jgi:RNA polymerase sigma-B factor
MAMHACGLLGEAELFARYREHADIAARDELLARYLPRAQRVAARYTGRSEPLDDLEQVAGIGLVKALDRYEPDMGNPFWSFALPTIIGELKRHFRDHCWTVRVPRQVQERALKVQRVIGQLNTRLSRSPSPREVAEELDLTVEDVLEAFEAAGAYGPRSLDAAPPGADPDAATYADLLGAEDAALEAAEGRAVLGPALRALPDRERLILHLRFVADLTQSEIAERVGISQMHVSRLLRRAISQVRDAVAADASAVRAA